MIFEPINAYYLFHFHQQSVQHLLFCYLDIFLQILLKKIIKQYEKIDAGFKKYNNYYIFFIKNVLLFPFFLINIILGLTSTRVLNFYLISQIGMLPATIIIVNIGNSFDDILSSKTGLNIEIIILLTLLGLFPLVAKLFFKRIIN
ncbi:MAG: hypothetical protein Ct9H90mP18_01260 [Gammaproteobacteria bacterium]|nr:MAG: hypothetical protein Ct9H90mP18_01260 [Gammaproteobacteria bacterium]